MADELTELTDKQAEFLLEETDRMSEEDREWDDLEKAITEELEDLICKAADDKNTISDIQPTTYVITHMAKAAAQVLMAFEHGYRIGS